MIVSKRDFKLSIIGRYPISFLPQDLVNYAECNIKDNESLTYFIKTSGNLRDQISLTMFEMYVKKIRRILAVNFLILRLVLILT